ncbi:MAG: hypothetical protein R6W75_12655 [Smithellaceae bacterium]
MNVFKILFILILLYVGYRVVLMLRGGKRESVRGYRVDEAPLKGEELVQDPFCKIYVPKSQAMVREINGKMCHFCSRECLEKYISENK